MKRSRLFIAISIASLALSIAAEARAFRMIQNLSTGRTSNGSRVSCDDASGFAHWTRSAMAWRVNPANQGAEPGVTSAVQSTFAAWSNVTPAGYQLSYDGTTNAGFATDGVNTLVWASGNGCSGGCLAITALVLGPGQVIQEADVSFNNLYDWNTTGGDYDVAAIAAHELGHCMGIHHTEITRHKNRPTMYASYFGTGGRTLEADDRDALNCAFDRYPPAAMIAELTPESSSPAPAAGRAGARLLSRAHAGHATLRFAIARAGPVQLEVFDLAGRRMATLVSGPRGAGEHEVAWDGETRSGPARRGVYFARLATSEGASAATVLIGP